MKQSWRESNDFGERILLSKYSKVYRINSLIVNYNFACRCNGLSMQKTYDFLLLSMKMIDTLWVRDIA